MLSSSTSEVRRRKLLDDGTSSKTNVSPRTRSIRKPRGLKKLIILVIVVALIIVYSGLFAGQGKFFDRVASSLGYQNVYHYAVVIDAGSSGSRVLAYKFRVPFTVFSGTNIELVEEYFKQSTPGLSSFADDPVKGADTIVQLIKKAEVLIPHEKRKSTPLVVRATAGLRLLPQEKANQLIEEVRVAIDKLGYDTRSDSVEIMDGSDEGIFIWYTVNLLHDIMESETMAALDLGGGSTQITYQVNPEDGVPNSFCHSVPVGSYNATVFTHSFLNLGLHAARAGVFKLEAGNSSSTSFKSVCLEPIIQNEKWTYANTEFTLSGAPRPANQKRDVSYSKCHSLVKEYVLNTLDWEPKHPPKGSVAAMSFFYDIAADAGIIDVMSGGHVTISQYRSFANRSCSSSNIEQPFACLDLVYIVTLLQDAYKISDNEKISLYKKVNGHEVSWALGLAYTTIMKKITKETL